MVKAKVLQNSLICDKITGFSDGTEVEVSRNPHKPIRDLFHGCLQIDDIQVIEEIAESDELSYYW